MLFLFHHGDLVWKLGIAILTLGSARLIGRRWGAAWAWFSLPMLVAFWWAMLWQVGMAVLPPNEERLDHFSDRLIAAMAFPEARDIAEVRLSRKRTTNDDDGLAVDAAQNVLAGICPSEAFERVGRLFEARMLARLCGLDTERYDFALGNFAVARPSMRQAIAMGAWSTAASRSEGGPCTAALFAYWGGDDAALTTLDAHTSDLCRVLSDVAHERAVERGAYDESMSQTLTELGLVAELRWAPQTDEPDPWTVRPLTPDAKQVRALVIGSAYRDRSSTRGASAAIRRGEPLSPDQHLSPQLIDIVAGRVPDNLFVSPTDCPIRDAFRAALDGDGGPLAAQLRTCSLSDEQTDLIDAMLTRVHEHRHELALALRRVRRFDLLYRDSPFALVDRYARYRDMARLAGDDEEADRWQALVERFVPVLSDRRRAQALAIVTR